MGGEQQEVKNVSLGEQLLSRRRLEEQEPDMRTSQGTRRGGTHLDKGCGQLGVF